MNRNLLSALMAIILSLFTLPCHAGRFVDDSVKVDGHMRHMAMYLPDGLQPDAPLVFILHGYGAGIWRENPMLAAADRHGFAVCLPQGLKDPQGEPSWNVGYPFQQGWKVDDVKALCRSTDGHQYDSHKGKSSLVVHVWVSLVSFLQK